MARLRFVLEALRANYFFLPAVAVVAAFVGARLAVGVEVGAWVGDATVESARAVLSTVASATITFASISFSVSLLIMQQGSTQFSPRVLDALRRDPFVRRVIAIVLATFTYCLVVLQRVRGPLEAGGEEVVPRFAVAIGLVLGVAAVLAIVAAIHHTSRQIDVSQILGVIADDAVRAQRQAPEKSLVPTEFVPGPSTEADSTIVCFDGDGWIRQVDRVALLAAVAPGSVVRLDTDVGRYAIRGAALFTVWPALPPGEISNVAKTACRAVRLGRTRTTEEDIGYGVRQLVDVALKALSPAVNDPTTAQDAIFHLGTVLVARFRSPPPEAAYADEQGRRLYSAHVLDDADVAELAIGELRRASAAKPTVCVYLLEMIGTVADAVRRDGSGRRVLPLLQQARLLLSEAEDTIGSAHDLERVRRTYDDHIRT